LRLVLRDGNRGGHAQPSDDQHRYRHSQTSTPRCGDALRN
jgi:hypothetical protein